MLVRLIITTNQNKVRLTNIEGEQNAMGEKTRAEIFLPDREPLRQLKA